MSRSLDEAPPRCIVVRVTAHTKKIVADALRLPRNARAELTQRLILSLDDGARDRNAESAWLKEVNRRRKEIAAGKNVLLTHEAVMREAWTQLHAARRHAS
jgi:hypothetical protein